VRVAVLFGSEARGTATGGSDVDIAVEAPDVDLLELRAQLVSELNREVDVLDLYDVSIPMLERIVLEGVVVHEAYSGAGALWRSRALASLETDRPWFARMRDAWIVRVRDHGVSRG
jgi:predicted nucleotidyltransferase